MASSPKQGDGGEWGGSSSRKNSLWHAHYFASPNNKRCIFTHPCGLCINDIFILSRNLVSSPRETAIFFSREKVMERTNNFFFWLLQLGGADVEVLLDEEMEIMLIRE